MFILIFIKSWSWRDFQLTNNGKTIDGATLGDATNGKIASNTELIIENKSDGKWHEVEYDFGDGSPD